MTRRNATKPRPAPKPRLRDVEQAGTVSLLEAGAHLGVGRSRTYELLDRDRGVLRITCAGQPVEIPLVRIGARWRVPTTRLNEAINGHGGLWT